MAFHLVTAERVACFCQHDRVDHLVACHLGSDKRPVVRQFLAAELYASAARKCFDPLLVCHFYTFSAATSFFAGVSITFPNRLFRASSGPERSADYLARPAEGAARFAIGIGNISPSRADFDIRGFAISLLTLAQVASSRTF
jgi:hypothetical protein